MDITFVTESILITSSVSKVVQSTLCTFISYYNIKTNPKDISNILQRKDVLIVYQIHMRDQHYIKLLDMSSQLYILLENVSYFQTGD